MGDLNTSEDAKLRWKEGRKFEVGNLYCFPEMYLAAKGKRSSNLERSQVPEALLVPMDHSDGVSDMKVLWTSCRGFVCLEWTDQ